MVNRIDGLFKKLRECLEFSLITLTLLIVIRGTIAEARTVVSGSMEPTITIGDHMLVEKLSGLLGSPIKHNQVVLFYPPVLEMDGVDIKQNHNPLALFARLTGLPLANPEPVFVKRVIGLPGDRIEIKRGIGVFVNDRLQPGITPNYDLKVLGDIGGYSFNGKFICPYGMSKSNIVVPKAMLFVMGDNRNESADSHVWGFVSQDRVIGRPCLTFWHSPSQTSPWLRFL